MSKTKTDSGSAPPAKPVQLDVTPAQWDRCHKDLHRKLKMAMIEGPNTGDVGSISKLVADIRAMELVEPTSVPAAPEPEKVLTPEEQRIADEVRERQDAAADPVKMQEFNRKVAKKEAIDAARAGD